ncbi:MAG: TfoX/Sxy family protein [Actinomycetales bacterium]|nr:TfoX/Sxy family protein [Actinomycetales bacterium]
MAYDKALAARVRELLADEPGLTGKAMFGGLGFLVHGNMAVAASGEGGLMVRADPEAGEGLLEEPDVAPVVMRGRAMTGWLRVADGGLADDAALARWVAVGLARARSLPPKN